MKRCYGCESTLTYTDSRGATHWYHNDDLDSNVLCEKCNNKYVKNPKWHPITNATTHYKWNPITSKKWNPINNPKYNPRRLVFKDKIILLKQNPRIGVCQWCRAVRGIDCKQTHIHHEKYDINDPLAHTLELCPSCHGRTRKKN